MDGHPVSGPPAIAKVIFRADVAPELSLELVEYVNGQFGILENARLLGARVYGNAELELCIEAYLKLCRSLATEAVP